jgi:DNA-binding NarL/FixJ family response regulator
MNEIILADSQAIFRAGTAKVLAMEENFRIVAKCDDVERMMHAIATFPGAIVLFASSLRPNMGRLRVMLESARAVPSSSPRTVRVPAPICVEAFGGCCPAT